MGKKSSRQALDWQRTFVEESGQKKPNRKLCKETNPGQDKGQEYP